MADKRLVVALDTSGDMLAACVARVDFGGTLDAVPVAARVETLAAGDHMCRRMANTEVVTTVEEALSEAGLALSDVDDFIVGRGPGSFTGVRIGVATAKGLACGRERKLYGASTLDAVAWRAWQQGARGIVGVVADAMRKEVYPGLYEVTDEGATRLFGVETVAKAADAVAAWAAREDADRIVLTGDGLVKYEKLFADAGMTNVLPRDAWWATGECLCLAAVNAGVAQAQSGDPALVLPVYTRLSDAEENEAARLGTKRDHAPATGVADELADRHLQLRPMLEADLEPVSMLEAATFVGTEHAPWSEALFAGELGRKDRVWWVAHDQGEIVGFAGAQLVDGDAEVVDVVVSQARRREGIARRLLARVTYDAQMLGATTTSLEVFTDNEAAVKLYESLGYETAGVRPDYYGSGNDAAIMKADLPLSVGEVTDLPDPTAQSRPWPPAHGSRTPDEERALLDAGTLILAVESSCDETAMALIDGRGEVVANVVATQIDFHARFGGVVPEIASRKHTEAVVAVYEEAMEQAAKSLGCGYLVATDLSAVAVTQGPGLVGALVVGIAFAKGLAASAGVKLIGVNHLEGHLFANLFETPDLEPPFVASLVSGGHTMLVLVKDWGDYEVLGSTIDDAVGEAFDKVAKALGLGYPGGPVISKLAKEGDPKAIRFPRAMLHSHDYRFSLSGLKTAVITYLEHEWAQGNQVDVHDVCASFQAAVVDVQVAKALTACEENEVDDFCVGGGVAANPELRAAYKRELGKRGIRVTVPPFSACTDNAAMIALVGKWMYDRGEFAGMDMDAMSHMPLHSKE